MTKCFNKVNDFINFRFLNFNAFMTRLAVIGAGIAGLAVAIRAVRLGFEVHVYEQASIPGGKIGEFQKNGFRFDMGPSLFTLPEMVDELLDEDLQFDYRKLDVITNYWYEDNTTIRSYAHAEEMARELHEKTGVPRQSVINFLKEAAFIYETTAPVFLFNSIHRLRDVLTFNNLKRLFLLPRLHPFSSLHDVNKSRFPDKRVVQLFDRYATYNGSDPYKTPGTLQVISHLEHNLGAFFPKNGMRTIIDSLFGQAEKLGVHFHFQAKVQQVLVQRKKVTGLEVNRERINFDTVISNIDIYRFYSDLLPDEKKLEKLKKAERSTSAFIFYWGMNREFPELGLHNIFFSKNYKEEFEYLFRKKEMYDDPTVYVFISSKENKKDAPEGKENWFVMVNAPENAGQNWEEEADKLGRNVIKKLNRVLDENIESQILFQQILDPVKIEQQTASFGGALYGSGSNSRFSAFNRHPNFHRSIKGLYFVGGSVHPGGGIPLCLSSAKIVAKMIKEHANQGVKK